MKLNESTRYYLITMPIGIIGWILLSLINVEFVNIIFFMLAYIWHFSLLAPKVKEHALFGKNKYSLLSMVFKFNYYLQMFVRFDRIPFSQSLIRCISPLIFTLVLFIVGGAGNLLFTLLGSVVFELIYLKWISKTTTHINDPEIPPAIPNEESFRE